MKVRVYAALLLLLAGFPLSRGAERQLISTGWDSPTAAQFRGGLAEFEKRKLFDGCTIVPTRRTGEGAAINSVEAFSTNHWQWEEFADCVRDLAAAQPQSATNNYLMLSANPGNVGWFDDRGWAEVTDHWRLLARVARKGRLTGLLFDPEAYRKPWSQFLYLAQADKDHHSFAEMSAMARQRGREVIKAVAAEYPTITIFAYRLFSDVAHSGDPRRPRMALASHAFGLLPAFVDGWCDVMPETVFLIDGNEAAYGYDSEQQFAGAFARLKLAAPGFVSSENRLKIQKQFLVGHGVYLDAYISAPLGKTYFDLKGDSPANRLMAYVSAALEAADGPVWIYGENGRWWPTKDSKTLWPEKFPGIEAALRGAKNPTEFASDYLRESKPEANLLRDASFEAQITNRASKIWSPWQEAGSKGTATFTNSAVRLVGMENGTVGQGVPAKRSEIYAVGASVKSNGQGDVGISIGWQTKDWKWVAPAERVELTATGEPDAEGWRPIVGLVRVPAEAEMLGFMLFVRRQGENGEALFRNPMALRVSK